jgi:hypothetical protein
MTSEDHDSAVLRLNAALGEQDRLSERYDAAVGTSTELGAYVRLRAAGDQVAARQAWLTGSTTRATEGSTRGRSSCWPRAAQLACTRGLKG